MVQIATAPDGTLTYLVDHAPSLLPSIRSRDLAHAWDLAHEAARAEMWGARRAFRFRRPDGQPTDLELRDPDASCWAGAVDSTSGLNTVYGLALCLRLLALVDLLGRAPWLGRYIGFTAGSAELHPALLRLAAETSLTDDAHFDEQQFRHTLGAGPSGLNPPVHAIGAPA